MGYRGKTAERERARQLRAEAWTLQQIAAELGVSKGSVSTWVRDVTFTPRARHHGNTGARTRPPSVLTQRKQLEIDEQHALARQQIGSLSPRDLLIAGTALYAGEGAKRDGAVIFANTNPHMVRLFCTWLRTAFTIDESRLRVRLYLHQGLDLEAAIAHWSEVTGIPPAQFGTPYRAAPHQGIRTAKHPHGCATVIYNCSRTHRRIMGLMDALLLAGFGDDAGQPVS